VPTKSRPVSPAHKSPHNLANGAAFESAGADAYRSSYPITNQHSIVTTLKAAVRLPQFAPDPNPIIRAVAGADDGTFAAAIMPTIRAALETALSTAFAHSVDNAHDAAF
jgi:hypothetical protein